MPRGEEDKIPIQVLSEDPEAKKVDPVEIKTDRAKDDAKEDMSEEDRELMEKLELAVERVQDADANIQKAALDLLKTEIREATSSMTSVPKPLKYLRPHYDTLKDFYQKCPAGENKTALADILSVLAMTMAPQGSRESLKFKLLGTRTALGDWGHEFVRSLAGEIGQEYSQRLVSASERSEDAVTSDLMELVDDIVPFHMTHNAEPEAVDLLVEVQQLGKLTTNVGHLIDEGNYGRTCLYLLRMADMMADPDDVAQMLETAFDLYRKQGKFTAALLVALRQDCRDKIGLLMNECTDAATQKQMAFLLARHRVNFESEDEDLNEVISATGLSDHFITLARELDVTEVKTPEDIYKSHLSETGSTARRREPAAQMDSARANLASTFTNAFVNAGFCKDSLVTPEGNSWLYKNKDHGMMSAAASMGMILLWNVEEGLTQIDKFLYSNEDYIKAGAVLGVGIVSANSRNECDPALALLSEHLESGTAAMKSAAALGLGLAYAGSAREDVVEILTPVVAETENASMEVVSMAALSLGLICQGTCDEEVATVLVTRLMESSEVELEQAGARQLCLALGLLFLGKGDKCEAMVEVVRTIEHRMGKFAEVTLESVAYAGSGDVLKVQEMLREAAAHKDDKVEAQSQMAAVVGVSLIAMGEDIGTAMAVRALDHLLQYGELPIRRTVPLALAVLHISNPEATVIDTLSRLSHDADAEVAQNAILGMGLVSAGTNNSRVAGLLRNLSEFYGREPQPLFVTRLAQGLLHMGKGLMTLNPYHADRSLLSGVALASVLTVVHAAFDMEHTILDKLHYLMYVLVGAMQPRCLVTLDEELKPLPVSVRVGQAVETVGQAGKPKTITGFQTHTTPVLLSAKDRAELGSDEYLPMSQTLEGFVILKVNPDSEDRRREEEAKAGKK